MRRRYSAVAGIAAEMPARAAETMPGWAKKTLEETVTAEILSGREQRNGLSRNAPGGRVKIRREKNNPVNNRKNVLYEAFIYSTLQVVC